MELNYKRMNERLAIRSDKDVSCHINYMAQQTPISIVDINSTGVGFVLSRQYWSIIDYDLVELTLCTKRSSFTVPARIMYSYKLGNSKMKRRYGAHFLAKNNDVLKAFITSHCDIKLREKR